MFGSHSEMKMGIIIMPFIEATSGYTLYQPHITKTKIFDPFFNPNQIIEDIQNKEVKKRNIYFCTNSIPYD